MKNLTIEQKQDILTAVNRLLETRDVEIFFNMSREMKLKNDPKPEEFEEVEPTGAMALCLSLKSAPAVLWEKDIKELKER